MKATRASAPKVRTGCRTCKRRRIKCDECKPYCNRCISTGRLCEGYGIIIAVPGPNAVMNGVDNMQVDQYHRILPKLENPPRKLPLLEPKDARIFDLFVNTIVPDLGGVRSTTFWQGIILPSCHTEPTVLQASIALATAYEFALQHRQDSRFVSVESTRLGLVIKYNSAIQALQDYTNMTVQETACELTLIVCVIFITLELLIGRNHAALNHLDEGRRILGSWVTKKEEMSRKSDIISTKLKLAPKPSNIEEELINIFSHLDLQSTHFGSRAPQLPLTPGGEDPSAVGPIELSPYFTAIPAVFRTIQDANCYLLLLISEYLQFVGDDYDSKIHSLRNKASNAKRNHMQNCLSIWYGAFTGFLSRHEHITNAESALLLAHYHWLAITIPLSHIECEETYYDMYLSHFESIVDWVSVYQAVQRNRSPFSTFSIEFGVVAPLWWTVMKCRHPEIRRKAATQLRSSGKEGFWNPLMVSQIGREAIQLEEDAADSNFCKLSRDTNPICDWRDLEVLIPLPARVYAVEVFPTDSTYETLQMIFMRKKWDIDGRCNGFERIEKYQTFEGRQGTEDY